MSVSNKFSRVLLNTLVASASLYGSAAFATTISSDTVWSEEKVMDQLDFNRASADEGSITLTLNEGAVVTVNKTLIMGHDHAYETNLIINGGILNLNGNQSTSSESVPGKYNMLGHWPVTDAMIQLNSGEFNVPTRVLVGWHGSGAIEINGGVASINEIACGCSAETGQLGTAVVTLTGGTLKLAKIAKSEGNNGASAVLNLGGGTLTTYDTIDESLINVPVTLTSGTTTQVVVPEGKTMTFAGQISGTGVLNASGSGTIVFPTANTSTQPTISMTDAKTTLEFTSVEEARIGSLKAAAGSVNVSGKLTVNGDVGNAEYGGGTINVTGTLKVNNSIYSNNNGVINVSGDGVLDAGYVRLCKSTLNVTDNASVTTPKFIVCDYTNGTSVVNQSGGTVDVTGDSKVYTNGATFLLGHWSGGASYYLSGGTLNVKNAFAEVCWDSNGLLEISGTGVANLYALGLISHNNGGQKKLATLNMKGGTLNLGEGGIQIATADSIDSNTFTQTLSSSLPTVSINLTSGTIGAFASWSSIADMSLTGEANANTGDSAQKNPSNLFQFDTTGGNITLNGALKGSGGFAKVGTGTLALGGQNVYSGETHVVNGTMEIASDGAILNTSRVYVNGSAALNVYGAMNATSGITLNTGSINLFDGAEVVVPSMRICDEGGNPNGTFNQYGGTMTLTNTLKDNVTNGGVLMISHYPGNAVYNLFGGTLNVPNGLVQVSWDGNGLFNVGGGTANLYGIAMNNHTYSDNSVSSHSGIFRLNYDSENGDGVPVVNLGAGGINYWISIGNVGRVPETTDGSDANKVVELGQGTLGATDDWSANMPLKLTDSAQGVTFNTTDANDGVTARTITLKSALYGDGKMNVAGTGSLVLQAENTLTGLTTVADSATLVLDGSNIADLTLVDSATLTGDGAIQNLTFGSGSRLYFEMNEDGLSNVLTIKGDVLNDDIGDLVFDFDTVALESTIPIINAAESVFETLNLADAFTVGGSEVFLSYAAGVIFASGAPEVPEPATWVLLVLGVAGLAGAHRKSFRLSSNA